MIIQIDDQIQLQLSNECYAEQLFSLIDTNRQHLSEFLPWVSNMQSIANAENYLKNCTQLYLDKKEINFLIFYKLNLIGRIGIHHINPENNTGEIGYWLAQSAVGNGIMLKACKEIIAYGFEKLNLNRIEIKAATENLKSQAIPQKLNFTKEGVLRQGDLVNGIYLDLILYALLKRNWNINQ